VTENALMWRACTGLWLCQCCAALSGSVESESAWRAALGVAVFAAISGACGIYVLVRAYQAGWRARGDKEQKGGG